MGDTSAWNTGKSFVKPSAGKSGSGSERSTSFLPEFDALTELPLLLCEKLFHSHFDYDRTVALALEYASGAVQDPILSVLSLEEMKQEATRHIELLKLDTRAIWDFEQAGPVSLSQQFGDQIFLQPSDDETSEQINRFEQKYECLVYHVLWADSPIAGECRSLLFISPASSDWNGERKFIESCGPVHAYVE